MDVLKRIDYGGSFSLLLSVSQYYYSLDVLDTLVRLAHVWCS